MNLMLDPSGYESSLGEEFLQSISPNLLGDNDPSVSVFSN